MLVKPRGGVEVSILYKEKLHNPMDVNRRSLGFELRIYCRNTEAEVQLGGY